MNNIGMIYKAQGNYSEALERYEEALQINEQKIEPEFIMNFEGEFYGISIHSGKKSPRRVQFK